MMINVILDRGTEVAYVVNDRPGVSECSRSAALDELTRRVVRTLLCTIALVAAGMSLGLVDESLPMQLIAQRSDAPTRDRTPRTAGEALAFRNPLFNR